MILHSIVVALALLGTEDRKIDHGGVTRSYRLHLPAANKSKKPMPLVIVLHGAGANGWITEALTGLDAVADKHSFAVVYPDGINGLWRFWEPEAPRAKTKVARAKSDDVGFIRELMDQLIKDGIADKRRVYVTGISNGAYKTNRLGCELGDRIAAIAPVSGTMAKLMSEWTKPKRPMPVLYFHGTEDKLVGVDGTDLFSKRDFSLSADNLAAWWAKHNGCADKPEVEQLPDKADDGTTVERKTFAAGKAGAPVVYYAVHGGGHTWPGGNAQPEVLLGKTTRDINASETMWEFFSKHQLPEPGH